jgi:hypothetical protein
MPTLKEATTAYEQALENHKASHLVLDKTAKAVGATATALHEARSKAWLRYLQGQSPGMELEVPGGYSFADRERLPNQIHTLVRTTDNSILTKDRLGLLYEHSPLTLCLPDGTQEFLDD